ncbi:zincin-like metallopeptidase domain-containing protein [Flavobacterium tructae]|uniref:zincin-like metallopeptidase domain-containing protein n=1 Tax=Flavobacterium tructae TaxID=1114873 RepID=UPI002551CBA3|nr:zincin-like metallopeptidase domain-containing protein [Flavobacterium tructae]MDL2143579.1 zincin-like metallopeptidase domain-containing protein [Flavobacterium tructae]
MTLAQQFNSLNGLIVSRKTLENLLLKAEKEKHTVISKRIIKVLQAFKDDTFLIEINNLVEPYGLNGIDAEMLLPTLEYISEDHNEGLNAVSPDEIYNYVTDLIINTIKKVGHLPWQKEWKGSGASNSVMNYVSKKEYSGANFILNFEIKFDEDKQPYLIPANFIQPYYLTFNQIEEAKAKLKKGSKARRVIYYTLIHDYQSDNLKFKTNDNKKFGDFVKAHDLTKEDLKQNLTKFPVLKYYNVFRADDCEGLQFPPERDKKSVKPIAEAQALIDGYKNPPKYTNVGDRAYYRPSTDELNMPMMEAFTSEAFYYSTFFHEAIHSTGATQRLGRDMTGTRKGGGTGSYAFEELIAELGAVFLCSESGILFHTKENSAKYLQSWNNHLIDELSDDNRFFLKASAQAQKASNHILGREVVNTETTEKAAEKVTVKKSVRVKHALKTIKKSVIKREVKPNQKTKQLDLFDGLNGAIKNKKAIAITKPIVTPIIKKTSIEKPIVKEMKPVTLGDVNKNSLAYKMANKPSKVDLFKIENTDISEFLGNIEQKEKESVVITLTGGQGSMKTRMCFQFMNALSQNYKTGHASIEEHPESSLYYSKAAEYLNAKALQNIEAPEIKSVSDLEKLIKNNDVIIIDSFSKMQEMHKGFEVDKDLRKKYDGKLFIVIFQQTTDGKMRGGSKSQFDGDVVLFTEKMPNYKENYIWADKNRYQDKPLDELKFNIFSKKLVRATSEAPPEPLTTQIKKLSFTVS